MNAARGFFVGAAAGTLAGAVVLGVGGRLAMAGLVVLRGGRPEFSAAGSLEVVLVGAFYGALGGLLAPLLARIAPTLGAAVRGTAIGLLVFGMAGVTSEAARGPAAGLGGWLLPVLAAAAAVCVAYGMVTERLRGRWETR